VGMPGDKIILAPALNFNPLANSDGKFTKLQDSRLENDEVEDTFEEHIHDNNDVKQNWLSKREIVIPRGYIWIEGDNPQNSSDSRYYGPIPIGLIRSRAILRVFPITDMKLFIWAASHQLEIVVVLIDLSTQNKTIFKPIKFLYFLAAFCHNDLFGVTINGSIVRKKNMPILKFLPARKPNARCPSSYNNPDKLEYCF
jgi:hypothetical protein